MVRVIQPSKIIIYIRNFFFLYNSPHTLTYFSDTSTSNLRFLTIEQALADLAHFINHLHQQPQFKQSKVILVGGSYAATMAAWFRQLYPHIAAGSWASSAPTNALVDFIHYKEVVGAAIHHVGGRECYQLLESAFSQGEELISTGRSDEFQQLFRLCDDFDGNENLDVWSAFSLFSDILAGIVQTHSNGLIERFCNDLTNTTASNLTEIQQFAKWLTNYFPDFDNTDFCMDNYNATVTFYRNTSWSSIASLSSGRQWFYQTCTEYGWYQTSGSEIQPFGSSFPVDLYLQLCRDIFGEE